MILKQKKLTIVYSTTAKKNAGKVRSNRILYLKKRNSNEQPATYKRVMDNKKILRACLNSRKDIT